MRQIRVQHLLVDARQLDGTDTIVQELSEMAQEQQCALGGRGAARAPVAAQRRLKAGKDGKELGRVPAIHNGKVQKFFFNEEAIVTAFDLNNVYKKCKEDKKFVPFESKESKKEK